MASIHDMEAEIVRLIEERGPQTGVGLREVLGDDGFGQWKTCMRSERLVVRRVGRRYLRLDQRVKDYARLSPSILREFLTYSVVGLAEDLTGLDAGARDLADRISKISASKLKLAERIISDVSARVTVGEKRDAPAREERFCVLLAGDIVYGMGHDAPRPERSTGQMVKGSDLDLVVITDDAVPEDFIRRLDDAIYQQKYRHLINPSFREEIDYIVKPLARVREQALFDTFKHMVSCKIVNEAVLIHGSEALFQAAKALLVEHQVGKKLAAMELEAIRSREQAEKHLLSLDESSLSREDLYLFYTSEESEEFE